MVVALVAGGVAFLLTRSSGTALALSLPRGQALHYRLHFGIQGNGTASGATRPVTGDVSVDLSWRVVSVDANGIATVEVTGTELPGSTGGSPARRPVSLRLEVAPDGRIVSGGDLTLATAGTAFGGGGIPGMGQFTPLLPDHPVKPGQTWDKAYVQPNPFGTGAFRYSTRNRLLRFDTIGGVRTAVIQSTMSVPIDTTLDVRKLSEAAGQPASLPAGTNPTVAYSGKGSTKATFWVDPQRGRLVKASLTSTLSLSLSFKGFPQSDLPQDVTAGFQGTVRMDLDQA